MSKHLGVSSGIENHNYDTMLYFPATGEQGEECRSWFVMQIIEVINSNPNEYGSLDMQVMTDASAIAFDLLSPIIGFDTSKRIRSSIFIEAITEVLKRLHVDMPPYEGNIPDFQRLPQKRTDLHTLTRKLRNLGVIKEVLSIDLPFMDTIHVESPFFRKSQEKLVDKEQKETMKLNEEERYQYELQQFGKIQRWLNDKWASSIHPRINELREKHKEFQESEYSLRSCTWITTCKSIGVVIFGQRARLEFMRDKLNFTGYAEDDKPAFFYQMRQGTKKLNLTDPEGISLSYASEYRDKNADSHFPRQWLTIASDDPYGLQITPREALNCKVQWSMQSEAV